MAKLTDVDAIALNQGQLTRSIDRFNAPLDAEFAKDVIGMGLDGTQRDDQPLGNFLIGETRGHKLEQFKLTGRERF